MTADAQAENLLEVVLDGKICLVLNEADVPCERTFDFQLDDNGSVLLLRGRGGLLHRHALATEKGWAHVSVRVHENRACQADCVISDRLDFEPSAFARGEIRGIRFQPVFLEGATVKNGDFKGQGLFRRGLHFSGNVSPSNLSLACICDDCTGSFRLQSFHAGFSQIGYFYSASGRFTLAVPASVKGSPAPTLRALSDEEATAIAALERELPRAPDGTSYGYLNPLRCPHCSAPYVDFGARPELRPHEYYGNTYFGETLLPLDETGTTSR